MKFFFTLFLVVPVLLTAQSVTQGRVVDANSGKGLAFATIAHRGDGTYTNADGYFNLTATGAGTDSVFVNFIGYDVFRTTLGGLRSNPVVRLTSGNFQLTEIVVRGEDERLYALLERCRDDLSAWPVSVAKGYFQLATTSDSVPVEFMQNYYNVSSSGGGIGELELKTGRVAVPAVDSLTYYSLGTSQSIARLTLDQRTPDFADHPLQLPRGALKRNYYLSEIPEFSDAQTIHIRFEPRKNKRQLFAGELWLDATTAELKKLVLNQAELTKYPFIPLVDEDRLGPFDVEFIYTFANRRVQHLQWRFAYDHYLNLPDRTPKVRRISAECSLICFDADAPFFSPRVDYAKKYGDYRKLAFFPYDTLFWDHAPQVPLTDRQRQQIAVLEMNENRIDYGYQSQLLARTDRMIVQMASLDSRNIFWSPRWRYVHDKVTPKYGNTEVRNENGFTPVVQTFLDAFPLGDSIAFNSATFLDVYATHLDEPPSNQFNAAVNLYFDLCEMARREMMVELRAGPVDLDFVNKTYDEHRANITQLGKEFFRDVRRSKHKEEMERYNQLVIEGLGVDNLRVFKVYADSW